MTTGYGQLLVALGAVGWCAVWVWVILNRRGR